MHGSVGGIVHGWMHGGGVLNVMLYYLDVGLGPDHWGSWFGVGEVINGLPQHEKVLKFGGFSFFIKGVF